MNRWDAMIPDWLEHCRTWIGREEHVADIVTPAALGRFHAALDLDDDGSRVVPPGFHWSLCLRPANTTDLSRDGHPTKGGFLPPVPMPRRMFAGGRLEFGRPIRAGEEVRRTSRIEDVNVKAGKSGMLCFVSVSHSFDVGGEIAISEQQDIVYRDLDTRGSRSAVTSSETDSGHPMRGKPSRRVEATPMLLFRYSALTFNAHRIHYDRGYCLDDEGYPGLVVHGPLQATLLMLLASELAGRPLHRFEFRSKAPLFDNSGINLTASDAQPGFTMITSDDTGRHGMMADAVFR